MSGRTLVLRGLLGCLFAACAIGVAAIVFAIDGNIAGPCIASSFILAVACGVMLPVMPSRDEHRFKQSGIVWIIMICTDTVGVLAMLWQDYLGRSNLYVFDWELSLAALFVLFLGTCIAMVPVRHWESNDGPLRRIAGFTALALLVASAGAFLALMVSAWSNFGSLRADEAMGFWFSLVCGTVSIGAASCSLIAGVPVWRKVLAVIGILVTLGVVIGWMHIIRANPPMQDPIYSWEFLGAGICGAVAIYSLGRVLPLGKVEARLIPWISILTVAVGVLASRAVQARVSDDPTTRLMFAAAMIDGCLGLTVIILFRIGRKSQQREFQVIGAEVTCPRCGKRAFHPTGQSECKRCACRILIAFSDTKCPKCHHDVMQLSPGSPCPECGTTLERSSAGYLPVAGAAATG